MGGVVGNKVEGMFWRLREGGGGGREVECDTVLDGGHGGSGNKKGGGGWRGVDSVKGGG